MTIDTIIHLLTIVLFAMSMMVTCKFACVLSVKQEQHYSAGIGMMTFLWTVTAIFSGWLA